VKLYLDANIIIYAYEAAEPIGSSIRSRIWHDCIRDGGELVTSMFSRLECRVGPLRTGNQIWLAEYENFFAGGGVEIFEVSRAVIDLATDLRVRYGFRAPNAIHVASAVESRADIFLTAYNQLRRCQEIAVEVFSPV